MHSIQAIQRLDSIRVLSHRESRIVEENEARLALAEEPCEVVSVQLASQDVVQIDEGCPEDEIKNLLRVRQTIVFDQFGNASASVDTDPVLVLAVESRAR